MYTSFSKLSIFFFTCITLVGCSAIDSVDEASGYFSVNVFDCNVPIPNSLVLDASNKSSFLFRHRDFFATAVDQIPEQSRISIDDIVDGMSIEKRVNLFGGRSELVEVRRRNSLRLFEVLIRGEHNHFIITDGVTEMTFFGPYTSIEYLDGILEKCGG